MGEIPANCTPLQFILKLQKYSIAISTVISNTTTIKYQFLMHVLVHGYNIPEAARNLGIHPNLLGRQEREYEGETPDKDHSATVAKLPHL